MANVHPLDGSQRVSVFCSLLVRQTRSFASPELTRRLRPNATRRLADCPPTRRLVCKLVCKLVCRLVCKLVCRLVCKLVCRLVCMERGGDRHMHANQTRQFVLESLIGGHGLAQARAALLILLSRQLPGHYNHLDSPLCAGVRDA